MPIHGIVNTVTSIPVIISISSRMNIDPIETTSPIIAHVRDDFAAANADLSAPEVSHWYPAMDEKMKVASPAAPRAVERMFSEMLAISQSLGVSLRFMLAFSSAKFRLLGLKGSWLTGVGGGANGSSPIPGKNGFSIAVGVASVHDPDKFPDGK